MNVEISDEEREILKKAIQHYVSNLREEIYKTEDHRFKPPLKKEEDVLKAILEKL